MKKLLWTFPVILCAIACSKDDFQAVAMNNPQITLEVPKDFPELNSAVFANYPTKYGVELGEELFNDKRLSSDNTVSCSSCHIPKHAFSDKNPQSVGIKGRIGIRNTPPIQNLAFMRFYNWDGSKLNLENQPIVPIITHEEMDSSILEVIEKISGDQRYIELFRKTFGDKNITASRIFKSIAQYEYTLISASSKYDKVKKNPKITFTQKEQRGHEVFQNKCGSCHSGELFTDQSFRNIGFPLNTDSNEAGRARVTGATSDYMSFRVPSLRNIEFTAPYGSFGQFKTLKDVLDYLDAGVLDAANLDPILKNNGNRIPLSEQEKEHLISFMKTLSDTKFKNKSSLYNQRTPLSH